MIYAVLIVAGLAIAVLAWGVRTTAKERDDWMEKSLQLRSELSEEKRKRTTMNVVGEEYVDRNTEPYLEAADLRNKLAAAEKAKAASDAQVLKLEHEMAKLVRSNSALRGANTRLKG